jgi:ABC-type uncharacterized transport system ATPase subunit
MTADTVLQLEHITKRFNALLANDDISLTLRRGEILALLGENGAGKTTLMNILFGRYTADAGAVTVMGKELPPGRPGAAIAAGVGMVHQHFTLAANLTVLENVMIGTEPLYRPATRWGEARRKLLVLSERFGLLVDPDARISELSVGERQRVEILKALYRDASILILDEPTAVLTQQEAERLFATLRTMTAEGLSLIFISHKLAEVMTAADRVVVLRGGKVVAERRTAETDRAELAELMVGRRVTRPVRARQQPGAPLLVCTDVSVIESSQRRLDRAAFTVHAGEILGIIGVAGNGQATLGRLIAGLVSPSEGTLEFAGEDVGKDGPRALIERGFGRIPEDRQAEGVVGEMAVWENAVLERLHESRFSHHGLVDRPAARAFAADLITRFDIRGATPETGTRLLSGGNMQKLILGRNLAGAPRLLLANQPTRGLDEGAIAAVHAELLAARKAGAGIVLISEDLDEVLRIADRVQAIFKGRLSQPRGVDSVEAGTIGLMMAGIWEADDAA